MSPRISGYAAAAALAALGAVVLGGGATTPHTAAPSASVTPHVAPRPRATPAAVAVATRFAVTARTWTASTRLNVWRSTLALTAGPYRRELLAARPTSAQLIALRDDNASSTATVVAIAPAIRAHHAIVDVSLRERTIAAGTSLDGITRNRVELRLRNGDWRVVGFTAIPGAPQ
jgi:hypothetical protein